MKVLKNPQTHTAINFPNPPSFQTQRSSLTSNTTNTHLWGIRIPEAKAQHIRH